MKENKIYKCCYCDKELNNRQSHNAHKAKCSKNLSFLKKQEIKKQKKIDSIEYNETFCHACNKKFKIESKKIKIKNFCCRSCSNKRIQTKEIRYKISKKLNNRSKKLNTNFLIGNHCLCCNTFFKTKKKTQFLCSKNCSIVFGLVNGVNNFYNKNKRHSLISRQKISKTRKLRFSNGTLNVTGGTTKWHKYKDIKVQGTYELRTCYILDFLKEEKLIEDWEYTNDRYGYLGIDGNYHSYLLDFKVFLNNKKFVYIETKGYIKENDILKWKEIKNRGLKLKIWLEPNIIRMEKFMNQRQKA